MRDSLPGICSTVVTRKSRGGTMTLNSRIAELQRKHMSLSQAVEIAQKSPASDQFHVAELKKKKLLLKEEISRLSGVSGG
ncbi:DUF465 domain-containing protein [uncultured Planktomarina sp.]|uniref:DUF465 domain-containing protein n=2 Tax=Planktomarina TaxID=1284657 RepID=UPI0032600CDD